MAKPVNDIQQEIIDEFGILEGDREMTNFYIMELGQKLTPLNESFKTDEYIVKGCQSKVWLHAHMEDGKVFFEADSNTAITKGLVSLLVRVYSGQTPEDIINTELYFPSEIGMDRFIGTQRSNGFAAMIKQMKLYAIALKSQKESI
ncbi:SufE family protein [Fulvivirga sedimenti]|uniref:SufE family protein n=1 Tax=Fulvivirga sedimenti TaxID=2879465 RepID=A0A9X1KYE8_9BACT|nr:SufE family protein [Fulvivirga sedimenti]MCA6073531.1 SufE family protein [Fulvivirga sedimenti]